MKGGSRRERHGAVRAITLSDQLVLYLFGTLAQVVRTALGNVTIEKGIHDTR